MPTRGPTLIAALGLQPHPEGGYFREIHRSTQRVQPLDGRPERSALTVIYFLLAEGEESRWHRVASDEVWIHLEGAPLELLLADDPAPPGTAHRLGPLREGASPVRVVPAGFWQAARTLGDYTLVACAVGPGFDFGDFTMLTAADSP